MDSLQENYGDIISIEPANKNSVSTLRAKDNKNWRRAYINSPKGREDVISEVEEPFRTQILGLWGEYPTMSDEVPTIEELDCYEKRIVIFLDLMGFRNAIYNKYPSVFIKSHFNNLKAFEDNLTNLIKDTQSHIPYEIIKTIRVSSISDSIVFSIPYDISFGFAILLTYMINTAFSAFGGQFSLRGGIVIGNIYHSNNVVFGPALVEAYELESKYAIYPRILSTPKALEELASLSDVNNDLVDNYFKLDKDRQIFFDILSFANSHYNLMSAISSSILFGFTALVWQAKQHIKDQKILEKYLWLFGYYYDWCTNNNDKTKNHALHPIGHYIILDESEAERVYSYKFASYGLLINENKEIAILNNSIFKNTGYNNMLQEEIKKSIEKSAVNSINIRTNHLPSIRCYHSRYEKADIIELADWYVFDCTSHFEIINDKIEWLTQENLTSRSLEFVADYIKKSKLDI